MKAKHLKDGEKFHYGSMPAECWDNDPNKLPNMVSCLTGHHLIPDGSGRGIFYISKDAEVRLSGPWKEFLWRSKWDENQN